MNRFPEVYDFAAVMIEHVDDFGYIEDIDFDIQFIVKLSLGK